jgi:hypothetical protein
MSEAQPSDVNPGGEDVHHVPTGAHDDDHQAEETLGPLDWPAWRAAIVGVAVAALMVFLFALAAWR